VRHTTKKLRMINKNNRTYDEIEKDDENKVLFKRYVSIDF